MARSADPGESVVVHLAVLGIPSVEVLATDTLSTAGLRARVLAEVSSRLLACMQKYLHKSITPALLSERLR